MVSEPNFVLGIKQKSLASKEDPHVHITIRSHTCLFAGSRLHGILQPPWLCAVSKSNNQAVPLPIRFVHIKTSPVETNPTDVLLGHSRGKPRNLVNRNLPTRPHAPQLASENLPRAASDSSLPDRLLGTRAALTASSSTDLQNLRLQPTSDLTRAFTRL